MKLFKRASDADQITIYNYYLNIPPDSRLYELFLEIEYLPDADTEHIFFWLSDRLYSALPTPKTAGLITIGGYRVEMVANGVVAGKLRYTIDLHGIQVSDFAKNKTRPRLCIGFYHVVNATMDFGLGVFYE